MQGSGEGIISKRPHSSKWDACKLTVTVLLDGQQCFATSTREEFPGLNRALMHERDGVLIQLPEQRFVALAQRVYCKQSAAAGVGRAPARVLANLVA